MKPSQQLFECAVAQHGIVTVDDARRFGIDPTVLRVLHHRNRVERVSRGVYHFNDAPAGRYDNYAAATYWPVGTRATLSHETALDLHELCDVNPERIHITIPKSYRPGRTREIPKMLKLHSRDLPDNDLTVIEGIPIVTPVRAILDGIEFNLRETLIRDAINELRQRNTLTPDDERRIYSALYGHGGKS